MKRVYPGKPCIHAHGNLRYISNNRCVECTRIYDKKRHVRRPRPHKEKPIPATVDPVIQILRYRRRQLGITQEQLAASMGIAPTTIVHAERGYRSPMFITIRDWLNALNLDLEVKPKGKSHE